MLTTARREAEEFARALEHPADPTSRPYAELTRTVALLRATPQPTPDPAFVSDLRERLLAAADEATVPATTPPSHRAAPARPHRRRLATLAAGLTLVGGTAGIAAAAQGTLPGDSLYPVKRGLESIQLQLTTSGASRGHDLLNQAATRVGEAATLLKQSTGARSVALATEALGAARTSANDGAELLLADYTTSRQESDVTAVRSFAADQMQALAQVTRLTTAVQPVASQLGDALAAIDQKARSVCVTCSAAPPLGLPESIVNVSAANPLTVLVYAPTQRAGALEALARKAEAIARSQVGTPENIPSTLPPATAPTTTPADNGLPAAPTPDLKKPVKDLLGGLAGSGGEVVPGQVVNTVNGAVTGLTGAATTTVQSLVNGLGGSKDSTSK
jgi:hypothetical protein